MSVRTTVGLTQLQRILCGPSSTAITRVKLSIAPLEAPVAQKEGVHVGKSLQSRLSSCNISQCCLSSSSRLTIRCVVGETNHGRLARDVDNRASGPLGNHLVRSHLGDDKSRADIDGHGFVKIVGTCLEEGLKQGNAGVVHHTINLFQATQRRLNSRGVGQIQTNSLHGRKLITERVEISLGARHCNNTGSTLLQNPSGLATNALASTSDHNLLSIKADVHGSCMSRAVSLESGQHEETTDRRPSALAGHRFQLQLQRGWHLRATVAA
eukprot:m.63600 g.63600  ORF g.63600 m.63600 type:complete len:268 (-) comp7466_c0_seq4:76-879(-)